MDESWLADRVREFASLRGRRVESWVGVEWALREDWEGTGPQFRDPSVPCLQLSGLLAHLNDAKAFTIGTYMSQRDPVWGLWRDQWPEHQRRLLHQQEWDEFSVRRELTELPTGHVDEVVVFVGSFVVAEVLLRIDGRPLLLMSGEACETWEGGLDLHRLDESVLVFTDPVEADLLSWTSPREGLTAVASV